MVSRGRSQLRQPRTGSRGCFAQRRDLMSRSELAVLDGSKGSLRGIAPENGGLTGGPPVLDGGLVRSRPEGFQLSFGPRKRRLRARRRSPRDLQCGRALGTLEQGELVARAGQGERDGGHGLLGPCQRFGGSRRALPPQAPHRVLSAQQPNCMELNVGSGGVDGRGQRLLDAARLRPATRNRGLRRGNRRLRGGKACRRRTGQQRLERLLTDEDLALGQQQRLFGRRLLLEELGFGSGKLLLGAFELLPRRRDFFRPGVGVQLRHHLSGPHRLAAPYVDHLEQPRNIESEGRLQFGRHSAVQADVLLDPATLDLDRGAVEVARRRRDQRRGA